MKFYYSSTKKSHKDTKADHDGEKHKEGGDKESTDRK